ncbi:FKBP-type peptidyl-prolyl cis-trans isomerase [Adlercreutzia faecimuris]|uniref:Peptidyl-prolyl cis-trans isomerase n=1 Tax=Adlercreutzia faecimuris TaxID=2897341 RepID=A0ABS9WJK1_9ACTN|nr:peptidylprolyl isomerase [Adlercreutzia sp. JBNU-10]MCI2242975.1 peptidylprolyl isomerase [Adlercreutzia sp. JBNU-10]
MSNEGKKVKIHYTGTLDDGEKFDSSYDHGEPIEFVCMAGDVIPGFDEGVKDMAVGDKKTIHIEPADAYGEVREDLIQEVPLENIPNAEDLPVGGVIYMHGPDGRPVPVQVKAIEDGVATFDFNHPLAGKALNFELELVEVAD